MSNQTITIVVGAACGVLALAAYVGLILLPALRSYSRWWERAGAAVLTLYVLGAFVLAGAGGGLGIVWFWDRIQA